MRTSKDEIQLDCLTELQAAKWFLMRERQRHLKDIEQIDKDLLRLSNIELSKRLIDLLGYHFAIPSKKVQTLFEKHKK
jgi:NADH pyrophosphatase NudC (nudix superfamily)